jgi:hypothetical protein
MQVVEDLVHISIQQIHLGIQLLQQMVVAVVLVVWVEVIVSLLLRELPEHLEQVAVVAVQQHITHQMDQDQVVLVVLV